MTRYDIIARIGLQFHVGNTESGEFSYVQALKSVGKNIKDYQKATTGEKHKFLDIRFENDRLVILVETKNRFSKWDKAKIQGQLQDYVRFEKAYSDKKIVAILAETDGDDLWVWYGQSVIIDDDHMASTETVLRTFAEYEDLCFGKVNDKIKVVDSIKTLNENASMTIRIKLPVNVFSTTCGYNKEGTMDLIRARQIVRLLAEGVDPLTGEVMSNESVYNKPEVIRALYTILEATSPNMSAPTSQQVLDPKRNAGKPWTEVEDDKLRDEFAEKKKISDIAKEHGRTYNAIESRLDYLELKRKPFWLFKRK